MLLQSHDGNLHLLPALPDKWRSGEVKGLVARGGFVVDMRWENGKVKALTIQSKLGGNCRIRIGNGAALKENQILRPALGSNPNDFYATAQIKQPLLSIKTTAAKVILPLTQVYDLKTKKGKTYRLELL